MLMQQERKDIIKFGNRLVETDLTKGTGGNLSVYDRETGYMAITPSSIPFDEIQEEDIVIMNLDGSVVEGEKLPSSEWYMHALQYQKREDIDAVIHAHTTFATVIAILREDLPAAHYMVAVAGPNVRCAEYATYGTRELAENAAKAMVDRNAVILANHGILAGSFNLENAFNIVEEIEYVSKLYLIARSVGNPVILDDDEMALMKEKFKTYGRRIEQ